MAFVNPASAVIVGAVDSHHLLGLYLGSPCDGEPIRSESVSEEYIKTRMTGESRSQHPLSPARNRGGGEGMFVSLRGNRSKAAGAMLTARADVVLAEFSSPPC